MAILTSKPPLMFAENTIRKGRTWAIAEIPLSSKFGSFLPIKSGNSVLSFGSRKKV